MAKQFPALDQAQQDFIAAQHIFFVGTAAADGRVNVSPKGMDSLRVTGANRILWRNLTGSGNETAGHLGLVNRITLMWCSFTTRPLILRCYGTATVTHAGQAEWDALNGSFPHETGARQVFDVAIDLVQTSCGYAVPFMEYSGERATLQDWARDKGPGGISAYWSDRNQTTIDGFPTGMPS